NIAGAAVFNYQDEWWPQANTASWPAVSDENEHAQDDREEWFGIIKIDGSSNNNYTITKKPAYYAVQEMYAIAASSGTAGTNTSATFRGYPNPCKRKEHSHISFSGLTGKDKLEIYNLSGELVYYTNLAAGTADWNLCNALGQQVAAGIYIVKANGPNGTAIQKIAVLP
ncbi:MAG: T9SS type A sorting domain-containing protein, partial [bacterium]|nr:T9SS type A sorting domain-containing protein [bacterium]